jgi:hypothetical protein
MLIRDDRASPISAAKKRSGVIAFHVYRPILD